MVWCVLDNFQGDVCAVSACGDARACVCVSERRRLRVGEWVLFLSSEILCDSGSYSETLWYPRDTNLTRLSQNLGALIEVVL